MRTMQQIPGLSDVKSVHSVGARSIPKVQRSNHLELYVLESEKNRLEKELSALDKRRGIVQKRLDCVNERIEKSRREIYEERKIKTRRSVPTKLLKTMAINY